MGRGTAAFLDPSPVGRGTPLPTSHPGAFGASILARTALDLGAYSALAPGTSIRPLTTPSESAPVAKSTHHASFQQRISRRQRHRIALMSSISSFDLSPPRVCGERITMHFISRLCHVLAHVLYTLHLSK